MDTPFDTNLDSVPATGCPLRDLSRKSSSSWIPFRQPPSITTFDSPQLHDGASWGVPSGGGPAGGEVMSVDQAFGPVSQPRPQAAPSAQVSNTQVVEDLGHAPPELGEVSTTGSQASPASRRRTGRSRSMRRVEAMMTAASWLFNVGESPASCRTARIRLCYRQRKGACRSGTETAWDSGRIASVHTIHVH
jgi:hypothetical protein